MQISTMQLQNALLDHQWTWLSAMMELPMPPMQKQEMEQMDSNMDLHSDSDPSTDQTDATTEQRQMDREVVEYMFNELRKLQWDEYHGPGLVAMAKQFKRLSHDPAKLLSAMHRFGEIPHHSDQRIKGNSPPPLPHRSDKENKNHTRVK